MSKARDFIKQQDDVIEACEEAWKQRAIAFSQAVKANANENVQRDRLREWHAAAQEYFRKIDDCVSDAGELNGADYENWLERRTNDALSAVSGFITQVLDARQHRDALKLHPTMFEPTPGFLAHAEQLIAARRPDEAKSLKERYIAANLPIDGFDNPRIPSASIPDPVRHDPINASTGGHQLAHSPVRERGILDIVYLALLVAGAMGLLCIVAGLFMNAGVLALFFFVTLLTSALSLGCIVGGVFAIWKGATANTKFNMFGFELSSQSVGVAFMAIGLVVGFFTVRAVLDKSGGIPARGTSLGGQSNIIPPELEGGWFYNATTTSAQPAKQIVHGGYCSLSMEDGEPHFDGYRQYKWERTLPDGEWEFVRYNPELHWHSDWFTFKNTKNFFFHYALKDNGVSKEGICFGTVANSRKKIRGDILGSINLIPPLPGINDFVREDIYKLNREPIDKKSGPIPLISDGS